MEVEGAFSSSPKGLPHQGDVCVLCGCASRVGARFAGRRRTIEVLKQVYRPRCPVPQDVVLPSFVLKAKQRAWSGASTPSRVCGKRSWQCQEKISLVRTPAVWRQSAASQGSRVLFLGSTRIRGKKRVHCEVASEKLDNCGLRN